MANTAEAKQKRNLLLSVIEWIGTHPFVTGLMAILSIVGFLFSVYTFQVDRKDSAQSNAQADRVENAVSGLTTDTQKRDEAIQGSLDRIEKGAPKSPQDRIPVVAELPYPEARRKLIEGGWMPGNVRWQDLAERGADSRTWALRNLGYEEIEQCAGTGLGQCKFHFYDATGNHLVVGTEGTEEGEINEVNEYIGIPSFQYMLVAYVSLNPKE